MDLQPIGLPACQPINAPVEPRFFNGAEPEYSRVKESYIHRLAIYMLARRATPQEVADALEVSPNSVRDWLRMGWFQDRLNALWASESKDIMEMLHGEQINSLITMIQLRDNPKVSAVVRKSICTDILDRTLGKPLQRTEMVAAISSNDPVSEVSQLEEENRHLRENIFGRQGQGTLVPHSPEPMDSNFQTDASSDTERN